MLYFLGTPSLDQSISDEASEKLVRLLSGDLDFHGQNSRYASHNFHSFPAKFPPQLPRISVRNLTRPGETVLDPMMGSGTTVLEAYLLGRRVIGFDIDPLALLLAKTKLTPLDKNQIIALGRDIVERARYALSTRPRELENGLRDVWDAKTKEFVDYWFAFETQLELFALISEIRKVEDDSIKAFFELAFSAIIITKSGGVSLALDLGHTRPHRAKIIFNQTGGFVADAANLKTLTPRSAQMIKRLRSAIDDFEKRVAQNVKGLQGRGEPHEQMNLLAPEMSCPNNSGPRIAPRIESGDAQNLPLDGESVDLIVTSPPYASNAIDYMRAHKFSLVWLGRSIDDLGCLRKEYIGSEGITGFVFEKLPKQTATIVNSLADVDKKKGNVLHRYYSEMTRTLREMFRVLKPGKSAIVVVGNSIIRGQNTKIQDCLAEIGQSIGFQVPKIGVRNLDRDRRMMPAGMTTNFGSRIQQRMHQEYVLGFFKPALADVHSEQKQ